MAQAKEEKVEEKVEENLVLKVEKVKLLSDEQVASLFNEKDAIKPFIVELCDASGSTGSEFNVNNKIQSLFKHIPEVINQDLSQQEKRHVIFWNSHVNKPEDTNFPNGVNTMPFQATQAIRDKVEATIGVKGTCFTHTYTPFEELLKHQHLFKTKKTQLFLVTDGEMNKGNPRTGLEEYTDANRNVQTINLKQRFIDSLKNLFKTYNNIIELIIIAIEPGVIRNAESGAGSDIFKLIQEANLTQYVTRFVSYTKNRDANNTQLIRTVDINKVIPPPGHLPFSNKYFSVLEMSNFMRYLIDLTNQENITEDDVVRLVQDLSVTLVALSKDKSPNLIKDIVNSFLNIFRKLDKVININLVKYLLEETITAFFLNMGQIRVLYFFIKNNKKILVKFYKISQ
jgi:hypothetical protein